VKVGDFGVAATLVEDGERKRARYTRIGTPCYMAPEVLTGDGAHTEKVDIWSLGVTAIELATGSAPYATMHELDVIQKIVKAPPPQLPRNASFSPEFRDFVRRCMNFDPQRRPAAQDLLAHPFLAKASGRDCIVDEVLGGLPPLGERFAKLNEDASRQTITKLVEDFTPGSLPARIEWSFQEWEPPAVKQGRFTIRRELSPVRPERPPIPLIPEPCDDPEMKIASLSKTVDELTRENSELKVELERLREAITGLSAHVE
jgi:serine/threonine-protein kinase OSR1/STK39